MTDVSRRAVIKATGAVGAAMLPVGLSTHESARSRRSPPSISRRGAPPPAPRHRS